MRITTLGTSHGDPTNCRFSSSTLLEIGPDSYLVDAGSPVHALMIRAKKDLGRLKAVFVTHMHEDHVGGLPGLAKTLMKYGQAPQHTQLFFPEERALAPFGAWLSAMRLSWPSPLVSTGVIREGVVYADAKVRVSAVGTRHLPAGESGPASFALLVEAEGKRIVFTGDLGGDFSDFPLFARESPCDLCICEVTHYPPEAALPILVKCPIRRLIFNHVHNPWHGEGEKKLRELMGALPFPFEIAHDGDEFEV